MSNTTQTSRGLAPEQHELKNEARILFTSVFGPYAVNDEYGSRENNPMELYHNQVTRFQDVFSLRMFHRSWGLKFIQANITAPATLLDFPVRERFIQEIKDNEYDIVAISAILPNLLKVEEMCRLIREYLPEAKIVVGGHLANMPGLDKRIDADHVVIGEGVRWFRSYLGEDPDRKFSHPNILSGMGSRTMGVDVSCKRGEVAATLIPSVGCPMGCNFCSTSAMFGGKGKFFNFFDTGEELFEVMCKLADDMKITSFFIMDENFLFYKKRALELLKLMEENGRAWALYIFSSANVLKTYTMDELVRLGISWVWIGLEGRESQYDKFDGTDPQKLVKDLQDNGIRVLGSTIIGLEEHTYENMDEVIDYAVSYNTEFHQFMLYTPLPGTPLFKEHLEAGTLIDPECKDTSEMHGQEKFFHIHPNIKNGDETKFLRGAFEKDFEVNGPSVLRIVRTTLKGYVKHRNHPDKRVRTRFEYEARELGTTMGAVIWSSMKYFKGKNEEVYKDLEEILNSLYEVFGWKSRLLVPILGRYTYFALMREIKKLEAGVSYEPPTFYEKMRMK